MLTAAEHYMVRLDSKLQALDLDRDGPAPARLALEAAKDLSPKGLSLYSLRQGNGRVKEMMNLLFSDNSQATLSIDYGAEQ